MVLGQEKEVGGWGVRGGSLGGTLQGWVCLELGRYLQHSKPLRILLSIITYKPNHLNSFLLSSLPCACNLRLIH